MNVKYQGKAFHFLFAFILCVVLLVSSVCLVYADDVSETIPETTAEIDDNNSNPVVIVNVSEQREEEAILTDFSVDVVRITPNDTNGFKAVLLGLFGNYEMTTKDYTYTTYNGSVQHNITTEPDYVWIVSACIFTIFLYCLFRLLGGVLCGRK